MSDPAVYPILEEALERFNLVAEADSSWRAECLDDLKFSTGDQWPTNIKDQRDIDGRPCLVMDKMQQSIRQVCNEYRQQRPSIQVNPVGDDGDVDTAEIIQGIIRHIEVQSDAEIAYDGAHESVVRVGFGSFRMLNDYPPDSDDQEIYIVPIKDHFSVFWQPGVSQEKAEWAFIISDIPWEVHKKENPTSAYHSLTEFTTGGIAEPDWASKDYIRIVEYFRIEEEKGKKKVRWSKLNAKEEMEKGTLPGTSIPNFTAYGDDLVVDGQRYVAGLVRNGKDPQRMHNYWSSAATEMIALAPKVPWQGVVGSIAGFENLYERANRSNVTFLPYNPIDVAGKPAPPPTRNVVEAPIQAMSAMIQQSTMDLKASLGIYDPSLGQKKGNESGKAIERLQQQGDTGTLNFSDNSARNMRRAGRVMIEWIQEVYDTPRVQRIIKPDGSVSQVVIHNGPSQKAAAEKLLTDKIKKIYDIGVGRYDVTVSVGPSYQTKRQQALAMQMELLQSIPKELVPNFMDLIFGNMDMPQAKQFAERAKKMLPAALQDNDGTPESQVQQLQSQLQQMAQQHQMMTQQVQEMSQVINTKQVEQQGKLQIAQLQEQSATSIAKMKIDAEITMAEINTKAQEAQTRLEWEQEMWKELHGAAHETALQKDQQGHEQTMGAQQQQADQQAQSSDQGHELGMAAVGQQADQQSQAADQSHESDMADKQAEMANQGGE